jgi:hypothetical protein
VDSSVLYLSAVACQVVLLLPVTVMVCKGCGKLLPYGAGLDQNLPVSSASTDGSTLGLLSAGSSGWAMYLGRLKQCTAAPSLHDGF